MKLERSFEKGRERRRREFFLLCVGDKKLNKGGKMLCMDLSFHDSLRLTLSCLYYRVSYVSKQRIMERWNVRNNRQVGRGGTPFDK